MKIHRFSSPAGRILLLLTVLGALPLACAHPPSRPPASVADLSDPGAPVSEPCPTCELARQRDMEEPLSSVFYQLQIAIRGTWRNTDYGCLKSFTLTKGTYTHTHNFSSNLCAGDSELVSNLGDGSLTTAGYDFSFLATNLTSNFSNDLDPSTP